MNPFDPSSAAAIFSRREALKVVGVAGAAATAALAGFRVGNAQSPSSDVIRIGVIGCGGRGTGALQQTLSVPGSNVKLTALADAFEDGIGRALQSVEGMKDKVDCPEERRFKGLDGYQKVLDHCDLVILATPPGFRPFHFDAAIKAGKHVFMEKPVCVDSFGARLCLEAAKMADEKKLKVVVGLQRRYERKYRETVARVREGLAGDIIGGQVYWNGGSIWYRGRQKDQNELQFQVNNWYHFNWLCGDHICEQHVHNIDVANWMLDKLPESAFGVGGRQNRVPGQPSEIYDHHAVNFTYPGGVKIASQCRQFPGGDGRVNEEFQGTKATVKIGEITDYAGKVLWRFEGDNPNPYQVEHDELHDAIRSDKPLNNAYYGVTSSFSAVLARNATYTGKQWGFQQAMNLKNQTMPENLSWESKSPVEPDKDGNYKIPMPADYKLA
ncbi:MAG: Gfo/Idh/MocA family oxidoreductase [Planctomycetia bacterium]|nr:Gfo/Idh/MocA family oxidoreductase [Planctomycetia bacterium]